jgi:hypothetical protein
MGDRSWVVNELVKTSKPSFFFWPEKELKRPLVSLEELRVKNEEVGVIPLPGMNKREKFKINFISILKLLYCPNYLNLNLLIMKKQSNNQ